MSVLQLGEEKDASGEVQNKNDKGVEMEEDFEADIFSVSKDSEDNDDENEGSDGEQIESAMGKTGEESEIIDEKLLEKEEDIHDNNDLGNEKYESGPAVQGREENSLELRGKEEGDADLNEPQDDGNEANGSNDLSGDHEGMGEAEDVEDMIMDKEGAYMDSTGVEPEELNQSSEEKDHGEEDLKVVDAMEEAGPEEGLVDEGLEQDSCPADENVEGGAEQVTETSEESSMQNQDSEHNHEMDLTSSRRDLMKPVTSSLSNDYAPSSETGSQLKNDSVASGAVNERQEMGQSSDDNSQNDIFPLSGLPAGVHSEQNIMVTGQSDVGKWSEDRLKSQHSQDETSTLQRSQLNPYRNVGDALEGWKERAKIRLDLAQDNTEAESDEIEDQDAEDYGFVTGLEKGSAQALGPADSEQVDRQLGDSKDGEDGPTRAHADDPVDMEIEMQASETKPRIQSASVVKQKFEEPMVCLNSEKLPEEMCTEGLDPHKGRPERPSESIIHAKRSSSDEILQLSKMKISIDQEVVPLEISDASRADAVSLWRKYEFRTTRLSQELAEQLRLVMEPTVASKLQGDYKTGKRINMKKVKACPLTPVVY